MSFKYAATKLICDLKLCIYLFLALDVFCILFLAKGRQTSQLLPVYTVAVKALWKYCLQRSSSGQFITIFDM